MPIGGRVSSSCFPDFSSYYGDFYANTSGNGRDNYIKQYDYNPKEFFLHKLGDEEDLYLGVELEIDGGGEDEEKAKYVYSFMNRERENVYCKHDGSLNNGFEIVTHPCTLEYHRELEYGELFSWLIKNKYRSHDTSTCGLHVHINRTYFGKDKLSQDLCISKLLYLFEKYWDKVELIARRSSNRYARRFLLEEDETPIDLYAKSQASDKYGAVNLKHKDTVEIRIFKGTLNYDTFISTLEFVEIMAQISKRTDIYEIQFVTWDKIRELFSDNLANYLNERETVVVKETRDTILATTSENYPRYSSSWEGFNIEFNNQMLESYTSLLSPCNSYSAPRESSEEERIQRNITDLRSRVRRSRNGLEERTLNREIARLEDDLRRLRRAI
jgi:hypothetical protein